jgi:circadian clock protein KaiC
MIERVESGIPGFDKLIEGGFVKGSVNLIAGRVGTGKTIFCCQYILHGLRKGESCVYVTLEESVEEILSDVSVFGWDNEFRKYIDKGKLIFIEEFPASFAELRDIVVDLIRRVGAKRFALDSLSVATMGWEVSTLDRGKIRRELFDFISALKKEGVTSLLIAEIPSEGSGLSRFGFEEFVVDGIIVLYYLEYAIKGVTRSLTVRKMRRTKHATEIYPFEITKDGIVVKEV